MIHSWHIVSNHMEKIFSLQRVNHVLECLLLGPRNFEFGQTDGQAENIRARQRVGELLCFRLVPQSVGIQNF